MSKAIRRFSLAVLNVSHVSPVLNASFISGISLPSALPELSMRSCISLLSKSARLGSSHLQQQSNHQPVWEPTNSLFSINAYSLQFSQKTSLPQAVLSKVCVMKSHGVEQQ